MTVHSDIQLWELWDTATSALINDRSRHRFAELDTGDLVCGMGGWQQLVQHVRDGSLVNINVSMSHELVCGCSFNCVHRNSRPDCNYVNCPLCEAVAIRGPTHRGVAKYSRVCVFNLDYAEMHKQLEGGTG